MEGGRRTGVSPGAGARNQAVDLVVTKIPTSLSAMVNNAKAKMIGAAVGKFITDPKTLHISADSLEDAGSA